MKKYEENSEHKQVGTTVEEDIAKFHLLFNLSNDGAMVHGINHDGTAGPFIEVNDAACRMLGYTREELKLMTPMDIDDPKTVDDSTVEHIKAEGRVVFERTHMAKDGHRIPVEISSRTIVLNGKQCVISMVRDITERKLAQERLLQLIIEKSNQLNETNVKLVEERYQRRRIEQSLKSLVENNSKDRKLVFELSRRVVQYNNKMVVLTDTESEILKCLMDKNGEVVSHAGIAEKLWGVAYSGAAEIIKVHVRHLREKIEIDPASPKIIMTKFGIGYYFVDPD
ncbi:winged helix-turn-helix domain-containing protein [Dehalogenimonas etheniformans]|uniref:PAS domain S-box protein n=1 Tax=Dehalogenimonas etheniformans TaxID=1536648 RepID=A0A2P5P5G5_9CHLR|nr:winged helix-turn-helix domain-containing protein [Dehalogenimonas etheniformans]PPD57542.1 PAS domain S-box protein [Dehalogenimonas etheniformans]QNT76902.1 PAS domain S-box protein [Dehalogenimonas etheniformans]